MKPITPTPYPDVNEILDMLLNKVTEILKEQFFGMYLFGSLANGGFDEHSDIDVLVVTEDEIAVKNFSALYSMHEAISSIDSQWSRQLEVSYIPKTAVRKYDSSNNIHPHLDRGRNEKLHMMNHDSDWIIQRYILRERGKTIVGPEPRSFVAPVSSDDLKWAALDILNNWIKGFIDDPSPLKRRGYQSYTVLTLCRILHTLRYGTVVPKQVAADWAKYNVFSQWKTLIENAWIGRQLPNDPANPSEIRGTLEMVNYALNFANVLNS